MKFKQLILVFLRLLGLIVIISLERVIGLPLIFVLLGLVWLDQAKDNIYFYPILLLILSYLTAVVYNAGWSIAFLVWAVTAGLATVNIKQVKGKNKRFLIMVILQNIFWLWWLSLPVGYLTVAQFVISYFLVIMWMRILSRSKSLIK